MERPELVTRVNWRRWARAEVGDNAARAGVEGPEANLEQLKGVEKLERSGTSMRRENDDGNMGVRAITIGLCQRFSPVAQLEFKSADDRPGLTHKGLSCQGACRALTRGRFAAHGDQVRNSITVHGYLAGHGRKDFSRSVMQDWKSGPVCSGEARNHSFLSTTSGGMVRQVPNGLVELKLRNQVFAACAHTTSLDSAWALASHFSDPVGLSIARYHGADGMFKNL